MNPIPTLFAVAAILVCAGPLHAEEPLLQNGALKLDDASAKVTAWKINPEDTTLEMATEGSPEGVSSHLAITIGAPNDSQGQLVQRVSVPEGVDTLKVSGWIRSEKSGAAFIQVKRFKGKKEISRVKVGEGAGTDWKKVSTDIQLEGADKVEVLCRWLRASRFEDSRVFFADISLER